MQTYVFYLPVQRKRAQIEEIFRVHLSEPHIPSSFVWNFVCKSTTILLLYLQFNTTSNVNVYYRLKKGMQYIVRIKTVGC